MTHKNLIHREGTPYITDSALNFRAKLFSKSLDAIFENELAGCYTSKLACFEECLLYFTITFDQRRISIRSDQTVGRDTDGRAHPIGQCRLLNLDILKRIHGNNYNRKTKPKPTIYAFVDHEGSRHYTGGRKRLRELRYPHIHGLAFVPTRIITEYRTELASWSAGDPRLGAIDSIVVEQYDRNRNSVAGLFSYCMKGFKGLTENEVQWLEFWRHH